MRTVDTLCNIATLVACGAMITFVMSARQQPRAASPAVRAATAFKTGDVITGSSEVPFDKADRTLVMFIRKACHFCAESMPFYRRLLTTEQTRIASGALQVAVVTSDDAASAAGYLRDNDIKPSYVASLTARELMSMGLRATPQLILVDRQRRVVASWLGELDPSGEEDVIRATSGRAPM